jgi:immediate early response 3-interacting protein 1
MCNALLILNRRRFLSKYGLDEMVNERGGGNAAALANNPLVHQAAGLLHAVQYLKVPVIVCNILIIVFEILIGG